MIKLFWGTNNQICDSLHVDATYLQLTNFQVHDHMLEKFFILKFEVTLKKSLMFHSRYLAEKYWNADLLLSFLFGFDPYEENHYMDVTRGIQIELKQGPGKGSTLSVSKLKCRFR